MKSLLKKLAQLILFSFIIISCSDNPGSVDDERTANWKEDLDYFGSQLKANHINFVSLISQQEFDGTINNIKNSIGSLQDYEIYIKLSELVARLNVAHTTVYPSNQQMFHFLPFNVKKFSDGYYITMANPANTNLLGKKIIKIGSADLSIVADSLKKVISHENIYWLNERMPNYLSVVEFLKHYGFTGDLSKAEIEIEGLGNITLNAVQQYPSNFGAGYKNALEGVALPLYIQNLSKNYWFTYLEEGNNLYIVYNKCREAQDKSFQEFTNEIVSFIAANQVNKIIIELRNNEGGSSEIIQPLLSYIKTSPFNERGRLFVITGNKTFSSALLNAIYFRQQTNCIIAGQPTGEKPNSYGEVKSFVLPHSGYSVQYCIKYFHLMEGDPETLFPDQQVDLTGQDYLNGRDPVLEFVLDY